MKRTKIVCTIGPASRSVSVLTKMVRAGMDVARLNFSHGTHSDHLELLRNVRKASRIAKRPVAILQDLQGPKIRVGVLPKEGIKLKQGKEVVLSTSRRVGDGLIPVGYPRFHEVVGKGDPILLDDGQMELTVLAKRGRDIRCKVKAGGVLLSNKGINIPDAKVLIPSLTEKDIDDLEFGIKNKVDLVALSFVQDASDVVKLRRLINKFENKYFGKKVWPTKIIVKIEKKRAVENFSAILAETDGVMVARGDLGIETPIQDVPLIQKDLIKKCLEAAKPVITATQMLDSMSRVPRPTRAEVSDVSNAVIDHTDAVMLSQESATGKYPVETVRTMADIIEDTEESPFDDLIREGINGKDLSIDVAICSAATRLSKSCSASAILVATLSGYTARVVSRYRPELAIVVTAESEKVRRQLCLSWGVVPFVMPKVANVDQLINRGVSKVKRESLLKKGEKMVIIGGQPVGQSGNVNLIKVHVV